jgi:hypothetical protein
MLQIRTRNSRGTKLPPKPKEIRQGEMLVCQSPSPTMTGGRPYKVMNHFAYLNSSMNYWDEFLIIKNDNGYTVKVNLNRFLKAEEKPAPNTSNVARLNGYNVELRLRKYQKPANLSVEAYDIADGLKFATLSVNPEYETLGHDEVAFKTWSESEGMLEQLIEQQVVHPPHRHLRIIGFEVPVCRLVSMRLWRQ